MELARFISLILNSQPHSQDVLRGPLLAVVTRLVVERLFEHVLAKALQYPQGGSFLELFQLRSQPDVQPDRGLDQVDLSRRH